MANSRDNALLRRARRKIRRERRNREPWLWLTYGAGAAPGALAIVAVLNGTPSIWCLALMGITALSLIGMFYAWKHYWWGFMAVLVLLDVSAALTAIGRYSGSE